MNNIRFATNKYDHFVRKGDTSGSYSNVSFTNKAVISIEDNLVTSVSHKLTLTFRETKSLLRTILNKIHYKPIGLV